MDQNYLDELKKLKEQKEADLDKLQELAKFSIPDFDDNGEEDSEDQNGASGETIKFEPVAYEPTETKVSPLLTPSRRARKPSPEEIARKEKKQKQRRIALICTASALALVAVLLSVFFAVRNANHAKYTYEYWGMGLSIENGEPAYTFFGNLKTLTRYDEIGQVQQLAEFQDGKCIKETYFNVEGEPSYYYTHEYEGDERILSAYFESGQMVMSEKYTRKNANTILSERTYYQEENRIETARLTLKDGNVSLREVYSGDVTIQQIAYDGTMVTEEKNFDTEGTLVSRSVYEYNRTKKLLLRQTDYDANDTITLCTEYEYDDKKDLLKKVVKTDVNGEIIDYISYNYDSRNNPVQQIKRSKNDEILERIIREYNDDNRIVKETCMTGDNEISYCHGFEYNDKGYITKSTVFNTDQPSIMEEYIIYSRNSTGAVTQTDRFNAANIQIEKSIYNTAGFITEHYEFSNAGVKTLEQKNKYDAKQRLIQKEETTFTEDGEKLTYLNEQYDVQGRVTVRVIENTEEDVSEQILYKYAEDGSVAQQTVFDNTTGKQLRDEYLDTRGRIVKETLFDNGNKVEYNEYTYDANDRVSKKKHQDHLTGDVIHISYSYDSDGILTVAVETDENNKPIATKEYDEAGNITSQVNYDSTGTISETFKCQYDSENRVTAKETFDATGAMISRFVYYYNPDGTYAYVEYGPDGEIITDTRENGEEELPPDTPPELPEEPDDPSSDPEEESTDTATGTNSGSTSGGASDTTDTVDSGSTSDAA